MKPKHIVIITSGFLPLPATKGGAVENLIMNIVNKNEDEEKLNFTIYSIYDEDALKEVVSYKKTSFIFFKTSFVVKILDKMVYFIAKNILKKKNSHSYRFIFQRLSYLNKVSKSLKKNNYDLVLLENHPTQYLALKWHKNNIKYANRYYYHCHNEFKGNYGCTEIMKKTKKFLCVSNFISNSLERTLKIDKSRFVVLRNCIDQNNFKNSNYDLTEIREKYFIKEEDCVAIFTGRIVPEKGVLELIKAIKKIDIDNFKLLIVGSSLNDIKSKSLYEERVQKEISDISNKVVFTGYVDYNEIPKLYKIADIAILPSIWDDPAPLTVIESIVCGLPLITTDSGGIPEYATDESAIILKRDDTLINNLTKSIESLIKNEEKKKKMAEATKKIAKELTIDNYYNNFVNIIYEGEFSEKE